MRPTGKRTYRDQKAVSEPKPPDRSVWSEESDELASELGKSGSHNSDATNKSLNYPPGFEPRNSANQVNDAESIDLLKTVVSGMQQNLLTLNTQVSRLNEFKYHMEMLEVEDKMRTCIVERASLRGRLDNSREIQKKMYNVMAETEDHGNKNNNNGQNQDGNDSFQNSGVSTGNGLGQSNSQQVIPVGNGANNVSTGFLPPPQYTWSGQYSPMNPVGQPDMQQLLNELLQLKNQAAQSQLAAQNSNSIPEMVEFAELYAQQKKALENEAKEASSSGLQQVKNSQSRENNDNSRRRNYKVPARRHPHEPTFDRQVECYPTEYHLPKALADQFAPYGVPPYISNSYRGEIREQKDGVQYYITYGHAIAAVGIKLDPKQMPGIPVTMQIGSMLSQRWQLIPEGCVVTVYRFRFAFKSDPGNLQNLYEQTGRIRPYAAALSFQINSIPRLTWHPCIVCGDLQVRNMEGRSGPVRKVFGTVVTPIGEHFFNIEHFASEYESDPKHSQPYMALVTHLGTVCKTRAPKEGRIPIYHNFPMEYMGQLATHQLVSENHSELSIVVPDVDHIAHYPREFRIQWNDEQQQIDNGQMEQ